MTIRVLKFVAGFGWGGTERQFVNLGLGLDRSRFDVRFGCLRSFGPLLDEIRDSGVSVRDYDVPSFKHPRAVTAVLRLARDIRRDRIALVHSYGFYSNVFAIPAAKLAGARAVASIRDMGVYLTPRQRALQRWVCKLADRILVNAAAIKEWLVADGYDETRISVIPNGVDVARFDAPRLRTEAPVVAVLGRVSRMKGLEDFIAATAIVAQRFPEARFQIIGQPSFAPRGRTITVDDSYEAELTALASDRVTFTGFRPDVERVLSGVTVSVMPSLSEGLSNTLLESMAAGVPVVATRVGGTPEVVRDGVNGLLVPPGDPAAMADAIGRLLAAPEMAMQLGRNARQTIAEGYSMRQFIDRTSRFYES